MREDSPHRFSSEPEKRPELRFRRNEAGSSRFDSLPQKESHSLIDEQPLTRILESAILTYARTLSQQILHRQPEKRLEL
jgi:hypothetical protein